MTVGSQASPTGRKFPVNPAGVVSFRNDLQTSFLSAGSRRTTEAEEQEQ